RADIAVLDAGVRVVPAAELNASYDETGNKATSVWNKVVEVLRHAWAARVRAPVRTTVDMLGGRRRYGSLLAQAFPDARVSLVDESTGRSAYALEARDGNGAMELEFPSAPTGAASRSRWPRASRSTRASSRCTPSTPTSRACSRDSCRPPAIAATAR